MIWRYSPIDVWPGALRPERARKSSPFRVSWDQALADLEREVVMLRGTDPTIRLALAETDLRRDGLPKAGVKPRHPGVIVEFTMPKLGRVSYASDVYSDDSYSWHLAGWRANLRAVTLGLEALRAVDRHGIGWGGEQYQGFRAIGAGTTALGAATMTVEEAERVLWASGGLGEPQGPRLSTAEATSAYRQAAKRHHPDVGGDPVVWAKIDEAKRVLDAHS